MAARKRGRNGASGSNGHRPVLDKEALTVLQLTARGYTPAQIAELEERSMVDVLLSLQQAMRALGAASLREAVAEAYRRNLIV